MRYYNKFLIAFLLTTTIFTFIPNNSFATNDSTITRIIVVEGKVICFDIPKELVFVTEK